MRTLRYSFLLFLILALVPACGKKKGGGSAAGTKPIPKKIKVAFITNNSQTFWKYAEAGCKAAEKELRDKGLDVEVIFRMPSKGNATEQRQLIQDLQVQGVHAIAVSPNDSKGQTPYFKSLNKKLPLFLVDNDVDESNPANFAARQYYIGTNNIAAGQSAGELLMETAPDGGKIVIFVGKLDAQNAVERRKGVVMKIGGGEAKSKAQIDQMEAGTYPVTFGKYTLLDTKTDDVSATKCQSLAEDTLTLEKDLKAMVGLWEYNPPAMYRAARKKQMLGKVKMVGFDENETTLQGIEEGHIIGTIVQQPFEFGRQAVHAMVSFLQQDTDELDEKADDHNRVYVPHKTIRKADVPAFRKKLKELLGE